MTLQKEDDIVKAFKDKKSHLNKRHEGISKRKKAKRRSIIATIQFSTSKLYQKNCDTVKGGSVLASGAKPPASVPNFSYIF
jgi:hypothetical protein